MQRFPDLRSPRFAMLVLLLLTPLLVSCFVAGAAHADDCSWSYDPSIGQPGASGGGVLAFADLGGDLVAGGTFRYMGGQNIPFVARWNGTQWSPMGLGFSSSVNALSWFQGSLHAFGQFKFANPATAWRAARWDGTAWQTLGVDKGLQRPSHIEWGTANVSLAMGDSIIVGGTFTRAGDQPAGLIAAWDGTAWHSIGAGFDSLTSDSGTWAFPRYPQVLALAEYNGDLIAGGLAQQPGPVSDKWQLTRWNGTDWEQLGPNLTGAPAPQVYTLFPWGDDLAIGGAFTSAADADTMNYVTLLRCSASTGVGDATASPALALRAAGNPFFGSVGLTFSTPADGADASLAIFDLAGRGVSRLSAGQLAAGEHRIEWNGGRDDGTRVPPGIYFARLRVGDEMASVRLVKM